MQRRSRRHTGTELCEEESRLTRHHSRQAHSYRWVCSCCAMEMLEEMDSEDGRAVQLGMGSWAYFKSRTA